MGRPACPASSPSAGGPSATHWLILAATPAFALWNPPGLFVAMVVFALVANVPCLVVLRYNRARLLRRTGQARAA